MITVKENTFIKNKGIRQIKIKKVTHVMSFLDVFAISLPVYAVLWGGRGGGGRISLHWERVNLFVLLIGTIKMLELKIKCIVPLYFEAFKVL